MAPRIATLITHALRAALACLLLAVGGGFADRAGAPGWLAALVFCACWFLAELVASGGGAGGARPAASTPARQRGPPPTSARIAAAAARTGLALCGLALGAMGLTAGRELGWGGRVASGGVVVVGAMAVLVAVRGLEGPSPRVRAPQPPPT